MYNPCFSIVEGTLKAITIVGNNSSIVVICSQLDIDLSTCALGNGSKINVERIHLI